MERTSTVTFQTIITWEEGEEAIARRQIAAFNRVYKAKNGWTVQEYSPEGLPRYMRLTATRSCNLDDIREEG